MSTLGDGALGGGTLGGAPAVGPIYSDGTGSGYILLAEFRFDGGYYVQRVASDWWYSQPGDSIGVQEWQGRIVAEPTFSVELGCVVWGNRTAVGIGSVDVADPAGELDWMQRRVRDAECILRLALPGQSYDDTLQVARCIVDSVSMDGGLKRVRLRGIDTLLDRPLQTTTYAAAVASSTSTTSSTGYTDLPPANNSAASAVIEGDRIPVVLGRVWQHEPVLTHPNDLLFQITDAGIYAIDEVLSGGSIANPPDSSQEDWDYASLRAGFRMSIDPSARITVNCNGIRALSDPIAFSQFSYATEWSSDGPLGWTVGAGVTYAQGVGVRMQSDSSSTTDLPSISLPLTLSDGDWVVVVIYVPDMAEGTLTVSAGGSTTAIRREGRHSVITTSDGVSDLTIAAVPGNAGVDISIDSVQVYSLASGSTSGIVEMMQHILIARAALPGAQGVDTVVISPATSDNFWYVSLAGTGAVTFGSTSEITINLTSGPGSGSALAGWVFELEAGARHTFSCDIDITSLTGSAGVEAYFLPTSRNPAAYITIATREIAGAGTLSGVFEPTEPGQLVINAVTANDGTSQIAATVSNISLTRLDFTGQSTSVDLQSLQEIDSGHVYGAAVEGSESCLEVAQRLLDSVAGWLYPDPSGRIRFGQLALPSGAAVITVSSLNMVSVPVYEPDLAPGLSDTVGAGRNWSPYSDTELAGITYPNRPPYRADFRAKRRGAFADDLARPYTHAIGAELIDTYLYDGADAQVEANRLTAIYTQQRGFWAVDVALESAGAAAAIRPDMNVILDDPLFGDDDGKLAKIVGVEGRYRSQVLTLKLWGATNA